MSSFLDPAVFLEKLTLQKYCVILDKVFQGNYSGLVFGHASLKISFSTESFVKCCQKKCTCFKARKKAKYVQS